MSIASQLQALEGNIEDAYDMVAQRGGTMPVRKNMENLDDAIATIPSATTYSAGNGIDITGTTISIDDTVVAELSDLPGVMTGATSSDAGSSGLVPAPAAGDEDSFLKGDGTWDSVSGGKDVTIIISDLNPQQSWPNAFSEMLSLDPQAAQQYDQALKGQFNGQGSGAFAFLDENGDHYLTIDELTDYFLGGYNIHIANGLNMYGGIFAPMDGADICGLMLNYSGSNNQYMLLSFQSDNSYSSLGLIKAQCMSRISMDYGLYTGVIN